MDRISRQMGEGHKSMKKLQFVKSKTKEWKVSFRDLKEKKKNILIDIASIDVGE